MFNKLKKANGITLIALIISIVVILILAGVAISVIVGDNGILNQSTTSVEKNRDSKAQEEVLMAWNGVSAEYWNDWAKNTSENRILYFTKLRLNKYLKDTGEIINDPETTYSEGIYIVEYNSKDQNEKYKFMINDQGNISEVSEILIESDAEELLQGESTTVSITKISKDLANKNVIWESSDENKLIVNGEGNKVTVTALKGGTVSLQAKVVGQNSNECNIKILNKISNVEIADMQVEENKNAKINIPDFTEEVFYSLENTNDSVYANVNESGVVTGISKTSNPIKIKMEGKLSGETKEINVTVLKVQLAKNVLKLNSYVNYKTKDGEVILCKVLYTNKGIQIVSASPIGSVLLGKDDPKVTGSTDIEHAMNSYMNAYKTLNTYAENYLDLNGIATDARCIGSKPDVSGTKFINKNSKSIKYTLNTNETSGAWFKAYNGKFWGEDGDYQSDINQLGTMKEGNVGYYLMASYLPARPSGPIEFEVAVGKYINYNTGLVRDERGSGYN